MARLAALACVLLVPLGAAAQQPSAPVARALAGCRPGQAAPAVSSFEPTALQRTGLVPEHGSAAADELAAANARLTALAPSDPQRAALLFRVGVLTMDRASEPGRGADDYR